MSAVTDTQSAPRVRIPGPAGELEAAVEMPKGDPAAIAVLCHPHPLHQGTMDNKVVTTLARAFARLGAVAVRFNFRGVGASAGAYADGVGERDDAVAAAQWSRARWPSLPLYLGGFSFGAATALAVAAQVRPRGLVAVAPPVGRLPPGLRPPECPWLVVQGLADDVVPAAEVLAWARSQTPPPRVLALPDVGHFFHGQLGVLADAVTELFGAQIAAEAGGR
jgi:alpha/beta superfamily hydrolase